MNGRRWAAVVAVLVLLVVLLWRCGPAEVPDRVRVAAAGGMACDPLDPEFGDGDGTPTACRQRATSDVAVAADPDLLLGLGDYQYEEPKASSYRDVYDPTWGRLRDRTRTVLGNQEYKVNDANTFFTYFGDRAGPAHGYGSFDVGRWHVVVLNTNCDQVGGCEADSEQGRWLAADLAADDHRCTLAAWHHPRYSTGLHGSDPRSAELWEILDDHGADLVLAGHEHHYERFDSLDAQGRDGRGGMASFVVGTGGQAHYAPVDTQGYAEQRRAEVAGEVRIDDTFGVLLLDLGPRGWSSQFVDDDGRVLDEASGTCR